MKKIAQFFKDLGERINNWMYPEPQQDVTSYYEEYKKDVKVNPDYFNDFADNLKRQIRASYQN
jgi:hypothetical protein